MKKTINQVIAYLLLFATLFSVVYLPTFADDTKIEGEDAQKQTLPESETQLMEGVTVVSEDISRRGEFEKHYLLSDGTYLATTYAEAVHFKDDNGVWQDVDTTLTYDSESASYKTGNNGFDAEFMTESASAKLKNKNGKELSWHYELIGTDNEKAVMKLQKKNAKVQQKQNKTAIGKAVTDADAFTLPNTKSELTFDSAFPGFGADIRYTVSAQKIKEDMILHEKGKVYALEMVVENCSYTATLTDGGKVIFADKAGNEYFYIDPPYMYDSQGSGSTDIDVALKQTGKKVTVTYTPSKTWLDSCERVYPVTFDPAVKTGNYTLNIQDTYVESGVSSSDAEIATDITFGSDNAAYYIITKIPYTGHLPIIGASLTLTATSMSSGLAGAELKLHEISPNVYFNLPETEYENGTHLDTQTIEGYSAISFDVTSVALLAACNRTDTNGLCYRLRFDKQTMQYPNETISFASVEHATTSKRPVFTLRYGYQNPESLISENATDSDNRYWITNTNALSYGRKMLWTGSNFLTDYSNNKPKGYFNFTVSSSDPYGMYIYGYYDEKYISAPKTASGAVTLGSVCIESLANATKWIAIRLSQATYAFVLKDAPSMALTRSGSTVKVQQVSSALSEAQEWLVYSIDNSDATEAIDTHPLEEGTYYINSYVTRTFLTNDNGLKLQAGTEAKLGNKMAWDLCFVGNGKYMIRKSGMPNTYLSITTGGYSLIEITANDPPPSALFTPVSITNNYYAFRNDLNLYLKSGPGGVNPDESVLNTTVWRLCEQEEYNELDKNQWYVRDFQMLMGESLVIGNIEPNGYTFIDIRDDFETVITGTANACTANGLVVQSNGTQAGVVKISATHIPTGATCECMGWIGDGIFRASYGTKSLHAVQAKDMSTSITIDETIASGAYETSMELGNQLWYTEYYHIEGSEYRYYYIHSLGIRDEEKTDNNVLTYKSSGELSLFLREDGDDWQLWRFEKQSNGTYVIVNKSSNKELRISGSSVVAASTTSPTKWTLEGLYDLKFETLSFGETILDSSRIYVKINTNGFITSIIDQTMINNLISAWNGISSNITISASEPTSLEDTQALYEVSFIHTGPTLGARAMAVPCCQGNITGLYELYTDEMLNDEWTGNKIYFSSINNSLSKDEIQGILIHELGHALKLKHLIEFYDEGDEYGNKFIGYYVLSCMNPRIEEDTCTVKPTFWDKIQFILKWGV